MSGKGRRVDRVCVHCGRLFVVAASQLRVPGHGRFCSRQCGYIHRRGERAANWSGGRVAEPSGYVIATVESRVRGRTIREHVLVAERALGRSLPSGAEVHHVNGDRADNRPANLVICHDVSYHRLLHKLQRIRTAGGRPFLDRICHKCNQVKPITEFSPSSSRGHSTRASKCKPCAAAWQRRLRMRRRTHAA